MKPDDLDLLRGIAPEEDRTPPLFTAPEREALFAAAIAQPREGRPAPARHPVRTWAYRLAPVAAAGTAAAVAVIASGGAPGAARHSPAAAHPTARPHRPAAPPVRTVAYIKRHAAAAIAAEDSGTLRVTTTYPDGVSRDIEDLSSGASRYTFTAPDGTVQEDDSFTGTSDTATTTIVDYAVRAWWTFKNSGGPDDADRSGPSFRQSLAAGALAIVGDDTVDGQAAIHLRYTSRTFKVNGQGYAVDTSDVWVNATSFLPIRETGIGGQWTAEMTWSSQPPTAAQVTAVPPAGFTHRDGPPPSLLQTGGGLG
jgi:hypothetical protein